MITIPWHMFTYDNTDEFTFNGLKMVGRVVNIHDGDTMNVILPVFDTNLCRFSIRLNGIDTCEIRSKTESNLKLALQARTRLFELVTSSSPQQPTTDIKKYLKDNICLVHVRCYDFDKYGRLLADVSVKEGEEVFSSILLKEKLAYAYDGGKKLTEEEQIERLK
jgi:endonuclease YncB( thermonuclease family)